MDLDNFIIILHYIIDDNELDDDTHSTQTPDDTDDSDESAELCDDVEDTDDPAELCELSELDKLLDDDDIQSPQSPDDTDEPLELTTDDTLDIDELLLDTDEDDDITGVVHSKYS